MQPRQLGLFTRGAPSLDAGFGSLRRTWLDEDAWVDYAPAWVSGHDTLFDELERSARWRQERRVMYERRVQVPRLLAIFPEDAPPHPLVEAMRRTLSARYGEELVHVMMALYRDGSDSVAWHGDTTARDLPTALVATVSLGARRRFLLRPAAGGPSRSFDLGGGDLLVMGGSCQRTWRHAVPKVARAAGPRIALMFRPTYGRRH